MLNYYIKIIRTSKINFQAEEFVRISTFSFQVITSTLFDVTKKSNKPARRIWREISTTYKIKEDKTNNELNTYIPYIFGQNLRYNHMAIYVMVEIRCLFYSNDHDRIFKFIKDFIRYFSIRFKMYLYNN